MQKNEIIMRNLLEAGFSLGDFTSSMKRYLTSIMRMGKYIGDDSEGEFQRRKDMDYLIIGVVLLECNIEHHKNSHAVISGTLALEVLVDSSSRIFRINRKKESIDEEDLPEVYMLKVDFSVTGNPDRPCVSMLPPGLRLHGTSSLKWDHTKCHYDVTLDKSDYIGCSLHLNSDEFI